MNNYKIKFKNGRTTSICCSSNEELKSDLIECTKRFNSEIATINDMPTEKLSVGGFLLGTFLGGVLGNAVAKSGVKKTAKTISKKTKNTISKTRKGVSEFRSASSKSKKYSGGGSTSGLKVVLQEQMCLNGHTITGEYYIQSERKNSEGNTIIYSVLDKEDGKTYECEIPSRIIMEAKSKFSGGGSTNEERYPRLADDTGKGIFEGFVIGDGDYIYESEDNLLKHLRSLDYEDADGNSSKDIKSDEDLKEFFYNDEYYYYTEWEIDDEIEEQGYYYTRDGKEIEIASKGKKVASGDLILIKCDSSTGGKVTFVVSIAELNKIPDTSKSSLVDKAKEFVYEMSAHPDTYETQYYFQKIITNPTQVSHYLKGFNHTQYKIIPSPKNDGSFNISTGTYHKFKNGGSVEEKLTKELHKLQRDLNSSRLSTYIEGDKSQKEMDRQRERQSKLARMSEVLLQLRNEDNRTYAKGGNVATITRKVNEVNRLIALGNENNISVIDSTTTWEAPMKYKPIKYSNGNLYIEYEQLDLYKNNRTGVKQWITDKYKVLKRNMEYDSPLNNIAKLYRKALKSANVMFEDGGMSSMVMAGAMPELAIANEVSKKLPETTSAVDKRIAERIYSDKPSFWEDRGLKHYAGGGSTPDKEDNETDDMSLWSNDELALYLGVSTKSVKENREDAIEQAEGLRQMSNEGYYAKGGSVGQTITFKHWSGDTKNGTITEDLGDGNFQVSSGFGNVLVNQEDIISSGIKTPERKKMFGFFKGGGGVDNDKVYIEFLNKEKGFRKDIKHFNSYDEAVKWAKENFERFDPDMIKYK